MIALMGHDRGRPLEWEIAEELARRELERERQERERRKKPEHGPDEPQDRPD
jgi:hypothetical protein